MSISATTLAPSIMNSLSALGTGLLGFGVVILVVPGIVVLARCAGISQRHEFHHHRREPLPRLGGVALAVAFLTVEFVLWCSNSKRPAQDSCSTVVLFSSLAVFGLGLWDDVSGLGAKRKLAGQLIIAMWVCSSGLGIEHVKLPTTGQVVNLGAWGILATVVWLVGITNLVNLIDGEDGLATGLGVASMVALLYLGMEDRSLVMLMAGMTGALIGFLWFNFPPARIYLGDGGAYLIGFQVGLFSLIGSQKGTVAGVLLGPLFVFGLPIADALAAVARRGLRGLPVFRADREHIHHLLAKTGMSRRSVVLSYYGVIMFSLAFWLGAMWREGRLVPALAGLTLAVTILTLTLSARTVIPNHEWLPIGRAVRSVLARRKRVRHARSLTVGLQEEARRGCTVGELYAHLVFAARRMGFTAVMVIEPGGRVWDWAQELPCNDVRRFRHEFAEARAGAIELHAPRCMRFLECQMRPGESTSETACGARSDPELFSVMADLLAEAWQKAISIPELGARRMNADV